MSKLSFEKEVITAHSVPKENPYVINNLCHHCHEYEIAEYEGIKNVLCKFCFRKGLKVSGFTNMSTPLGRDNQFNNHQAEDHS